MSYSYRPNDSELNAITQRAQRHVAKVLNEYEDGQPFVMEPQYWLWAIGYIQELETNLAQAERDADRFLKDAEEADADRQDVVRILAEYQERQ